MRCPRCQQDAPFGARVCPTCAASLRRRSASASARGTTLEATLTAIAKTAARLCEARDAQIFLVEGENLRLVGQHGSLRTAQRPGESFPLSNHTVSTHAVRERRVIHVRDLKAVVRTQYPDLVAHQRGVGVRTILAAPLISKGAAIGVILIRRLKVRPFTAKQVALLKTFADQAAIAIENARLFTELQQKNQALTAAHAKVTEALEQQTATSEILRVISRSPTDAQQVFEAIARSAATLCEANLSGVFPFDGELIHFGPQHGRTREEVETARQAFPQRPSRLSVTARAILTAAVVQVADVSEDPEVADTLRVFRTVLSVPMLRDGRPLGAITAARRVVRPFTARQIALLQTFADQAVIAIENVRLFTELQEKNHALTEAHARVTEALEQQTATSEVLRVISSALTDVQPVFRAILERATRLCGAELGHFWLYEEDGTFSLVESHGSSPEHVEWLRSRRHRFGPPFFRETGPWEAGQIEDVRTTEPYRRGDEVWVRSVDNEGFRTLLNVPLVQDGRFIGALSIYRREVRRFAAPQVNLVKTFADQAVIAIENVRLFKELQTRTADLTRSVEQLTALGEVGRAVSSTLEVEAVLDTIVSRASQLAGADACTIYEYDEPSEEFHLRATHNLDPAFVEVIRAMPLRRGEGVMGRAAQMREPVQVADITQPGAYQSSLREVLLEAGYRALLSVPVLREDQVIGSLSLTRKMPGEFSREIVELLQTFATQSALAIQNARLFKEVESRNAELTESLERQTATSEILKVISGLPTDLQPVFEAILDNAVRMCRALYGLIWRYDGDRIALAGTHNVTPDEVAELRRQFPVQFGTSDLHLHQVMRSGAVLEIPDADGYEHATPSMRARWRARGVKSLLIVPMRRQSDVIGAIGVSHRDLAAFSRSHVELLKTFADQAVIAIENVRLFNDIQQKSRQLEAASRHKSEFLANMSHELRTPLNAITGFSEVLLERMFGEINPKQTEYLQDILSSGRHLLSLINDILDLSKIEAGRMELTTAKFHLPLTLESALTLVKERAARHGIALDVDIDPALGDIVGDERKIKQILLNLLSNAVKFTPEGGRIGVKAALSDGMIEIAVSDTGIGIAPKDQEAIFEEFRQVGSDEARKMEGTGLGLTLTKKFVEMHGGRIWVESGVGKGSTFRFRLPTK